MKTAKKARLTAALVVTAALAGVLVNRSTGWIVRQQVSAAWSGLLPAGAIEARAARGEARVERLAAAHPEDFPLQLAVAHRSSGPLGTEWPKDATVVARLNALESRNPHQPMLLAATLRYLCLTRMKLDERNEQKLLEPESSKARSDWKMGVPVDAATLAEWESAASAGERADPTNSFFPYMRAVGLFAAHQDDRACDEIVKAGALRRYNDYIVDESVGGWEVADARNGGESGSLAKMAVSASILLPHMATMRAAARLAVVMAVEREQAGQTEAGFAVRYALGRCGAQMRVDGSTFIGNLVGEAITGISSARPGGEPALTRGKDVSSDELTALRIAHYKAYLTRIGHPEEIATVDNDEAARKTTKAMWSATEDTGPLSMRDFATLFAAWGAGVLLIGNILWVALLGGLAVLLAQTKQVRSGLSLNPAVKIGVLGSLGSLGVVIAATGLCGADASVNVYSCVALFAPVTMLALVVWQARRSSGNSKVGVGASVAAWLTSVGVITLAVGLVWLLSGSLVQYVSGLREMFGNVDNGDAVSQNALARVIFGLFSAIVPLTAMLILAVRSRFRRMPVSVGVVRGLVACALPTVYVLSLLYVSTVVWTAGREARTLTELSRSVRHEGRFHAEMLGQTWPALDAPANTQ